MVRYTTEITNKIETLARPILQHALISLQVLTWCLRERGSSSWRSPVPKLTKRVIDAAELREKDYVIWDDDLPGFVSACSPQASAAI